ncbi:MAG TPA: hypothetical protein VGC82_21040 [Rhodopila sp.]
MSDFLGAGGGMHALAHGMFGAVAGDALLGLAHLPSQVGGLFLQQYGGGFDEATLRPVLVLDIHVHRIIDGRRGDHRVVGGETDLDDVREPYRGGMQAVLDRQHGALARPVLHRPKDRFVRRCVGLHSKQPA